MGENRDNSPKIEIINHFDNLIQRIDIDIEECLEKYNEEKVIGDLKFYKSYKKNEITTKRRANTIYSYYCGFILNKIPIYKEHYNTEHIWLNNAKNIEKYPKLNKIYYKDFDFEYNTIYKTVDLWSEETKVVDYLNQVRMRTIEELRKAQKEALDCYKAQLLPEKFYFQVRYTQSEPEEWIFKLFTFVTDFYMSPYDISLFE